MSERKSFRRTLRTGGSGPVPEYMRCYFAGIEHPQTPWEALLPHEWPTLLNWWKQYEAEHPGAVPPDDNAWLASPDRDRGLPGYGIGD